VMVAGPANLSLFGQTLIAFEKFWIRLPTLGTPLRDGGGGLISGC